MVAGIFAVCDWLACPGGCSILRPDKVQPEPEPEPTVPLDRIYTPRSNQSLPGFLPPSGSGGSEVGTDVIWSSTGTRAGKACQRFGGTAGSWIRLVRRDPLLRVRAQVVHLPLFSRTAEFTPTVYQACRCTKGTVRRGVGLGSKSQRSNERRAVSQRKE